MKNQKIKILALFIAYGLISNSYYAQKDVNLVGDNTTMEQGCEAFDIPYLNNFDDGDDECWTVMDINDDNLYWELDETQATISCSEPNDMVLSINYNSSQDMDDWIISPAFNLQTGVDYYFSFSYGNDGGPTWSESLEVFISNDNTLNAITNGEQLFSDNDIVGGCHNFANSTMSVNQDGIYYIAFHGNSSQNQNILMIDDFEISVQGVSVDEFGNDYDSIEMFLHKDGLVVDMIDESNQLSKINIINMSGQLIYTEEVVFSKGENFIHLPISLSNGVFLVNLIGNDTIVSRKVVVK